MKKFIVGTVGMLLIFAGLSMAVLYEPREAKSVYRDIMEYKIICKGGLLYYEVKTNGHGGGLAPVLNSKDEVIRCD